MRYLVTGGTGFVGAYVVEALVNANHEVTLFDIAPNRQFLKEVVGLDDSKVRILSGDVTDAFAVLKAMRESGAQRVIHLAAMLGHLCDINPIRALRVNAEGTLNIFEAALECSVEKVVWASTIGVFGTFGQSKEGGAQVFGNDSPHRPQGVYGACKSFCENVARLYERQRGLDAIGLRFSMAYGYGKALTAQRGTRVGFIADLVDGPALGQPTTIANGDSNLDWVYVGDAARSAVLASESLKTKEVAVNITGERYTIREVAGVVKKLLPDAQLKVEDGSWGYDLVFDATAAEREIGYRPTTSIENGIRQNINKVRVANNLKPI